MRKQFSLSLPISASQEKISELLSSVQVQTTAIEKAGGVIQKVSIDLAGEFNAQSTATVYFEIEGDYKDSWGYEYRKFTTTASKESIAVQQINQRINMWLDDNSDISIYTTSINVEVNRKDEFVAVGEVFYADK